MSTTSRERRRIDRLILVYAAESGLTNAVVDSAKKLLMVKGCSLCAITHGLAMRGLHIPSPTAPAAPGAP
ncbi:MAG TPA: hypothetical protein VLF66_03190 [Thermoanaerobaculia bacterium]|nr:hypothetical protein [Thermoanaerobaculia bacterium]